MTDVSRLADTAHATTVAVVGGGLGGLVTAYECAKLGMPVTVFEASERIGGVARTVDLGGARADVAASAFSGSAELDALLAELGLAGEVEPEAETQRMTAVAGRLLPLPPGVLGIPANPFLTDVVKIVGWGGAWRAYLDRLRPPLTIGHERSLAKLVGGRMGDRVLDRLVVPRTRGGFGLLPDEVDVEVAAPGLNAALTTQGSLSGAAGAVLDDRAPRPLRSFRAGIGVLAETLERRIRELGGAVRTSVEVSSVTTTATGFRVRGVAHAAADARPEAPGDAAVDQSAAPEQDDAEAVDETFAVVFLATDEAPGRTLLAETAGLLAAEPQGPLVGVAGVLVRREAEPGWGAGVLTTAADDRVWSVTDDTARWPQRDRPAATRVLRAVLPHGAAPDDAAVVRELTRVMGDLGQVLAVSVETMRIAPPASLRGFEERARGVRAAAAGVRGLGVVGAWVAGSGIASVVSDAVDESERVRRAVLFGAASD